MKKYEAMFILKPDLAEEAKKALLVQINDVITKNGGAVIQASIWAERKKLYFAIKKYQEALYYLVNFDLPPEAVVKIVQVYKLNEDVLRVLITAKD
jgi:small subunit ribosomal protein S6